MKKLIATTLFTAALSFSAVANENQESDISQVCGSYSEVAGNIMTARQKNVSIIEVYKLANGNKIVIAMIKDAYARPLFSTDDYKNSIIVSFSNDVFLACINSFDEEV